MRHAITPATLLLTASVLAAQPVVWVAGDLTRVRPSEPPGAARAVDLKAARNEYAPFQIVVRAGAAPLSNVAVEAADLRSDAGEVIPASALTLYREHYVEVRTPSPKSVDGAGWYPDALIPLEAGGGRFRGTPFDVEPETNQPVWIDLLVPADAPSGRYRGPVRVVADGAPPVEVPVSLQVWDFALPRTPSMRASFGSPASRAAAWYKLTSDGAEVRALEHEHAGMMAAHRISPHLPSWLRPRVNNDGSIDPSPTHEQLKEWIERYRLNGLPVPLLGSDPAGRDRERNLRYLAGMWAYLKANGWDRIAYVYVLDEPNDAAAYEQVRARAGLIHEAAPGLKVLCTEQPTPSNAAWGTLVGSVDIWVPLWHLFEENAGQERLAAGDELWSYTALTQGPRGRETPYWQLDFPLLNYRVPAWINRRFGMTGLLYWTTNYWDPAVDPWATALTFRNMYNYEGLLVYPGREAGASGFVASIRLKQIREGMEDYEYLRLLEANWFREEVEARVRGMARSWTDWETNPANFYAEREAIAARILETMPERTP